MTDETDECKIKEGLEVGVTAVFSLLFSALFIFAHERGSNRMFKILASYMPNLQHVHDRTSFYEFAGMSVDHKDKLAGLADLFLI